LGGNCLAEKFGSTLLNLGDAIVPICWVDDEALWHVQEIAQILQWAKWQIARAIDVLELGDFGDSDLGKLVDASRVDLFAGKTEDNVPTMDQGQPELRSGIPAQSETWSSSQHRTPMRSFRTD